MWLCWRDHWIFQVGNVERPCRAGRRGRYLPLLLLNTSVLLAGLGTQHPAKALPYWSCSPGAARAVGSNTEGGQPRHHHLRWAAASPASTSSTYLNLLTKCAYLAGHWEVLQWDFVMLTAWVVLVECIHFKAQSYPSLPHNLYPELVSNLLKMAFWRLGQNHRRRFHSAVLHRFIWKGLKAKPPPYLHIMLLYYVELSRICSSYLWPHYVLNRMMWPEN